MILCSRRLLVLIVFLWIRSGAFFLTKFPSSFVGTWNEVDQQVIYTPGENLDPSAYRDNVPTKTKRISQLPHTERFTEAPKSSIYFSGAGVYFWWQAGAAQYIQNFCDISEVKCYGASAGSITASLLLSGANFDESLDVAMGLMEKHGVYESRTGLNGVLGNLVREWIDIVLPHDHEEFLDSMKNLDIALTPAGFNIPKNPKLVSCFSNREELIECLMASCHIPILLNGRPTTVYKNESVIDGSFWYFITKSRWSGLPLPLDHDPKNIFWVDYTDDEIFMEKISGNIMEVYDRDFIEEMIRDGYLFMKREDEKNALPFKKKADVDANVIASSIYEDDSEIMNFEFPFLMIDKWTKFILGPVKELWSESVDSQTNILQQYW